jgi:hypothetical protein
MKGPGVAVVLCLLVPVIALGVYGGHVLVTMDAEAEREAIAAAARKVEQEKARAAKIERGWLEDAASREEERAKKARANAIARQLHPGLAEAHAALEAAYKRQESGQEIADAEQRFEAAAAEARKTGGDKVLAEIQEMEQRHKRLREQAASSAP